MKHCAGYSAVSRRLAQVCVLLLTLSSSPAQAEVALGASLPELLSYARQHNPALAAERAETEATHARAEAAGTLPDPSFQIELMDVTNSMRGGGTTILPGQVGETRYRIVQPLPAWGKRELDSRAAQTRAERAEATQAQTWLNLAAEIKTAWLRYYAADREQMLNDDALALLQALEDTTLTRYRLGLASQQAVLRTQREITGRRLASITIAQRRHAAQAALNALLSRPASSALALPLDPPALPRLQPYAGLLDIARATSPALAAEAHAVEVAQLERDRTRRDRYPDFSIGLTNNQPRGGDASWDLMLEMMIPLQQSARRAREREAAHLLDAADARRTAAMASLEGELGRAHAAYLAGRESLNLLMASLLPQATATRDAARNAFANNRVDFDTVLEAEEQLIATRIQILETEVATRLALVELEKIVGELQ